MSMSPTRPGRSGSSGYSFPRPSYVPAAGTSASGSVSEPSSPSPRRPAETQNQNQHHYRTPSTKYDTTAFAEIVDPSFAALDAQYRVVSSDNVVFYLRPKLVTQW